MSNSQPITGLDFFRHKWYTHKRHRQAEAEVVPSSSLVEIEVEVGVEFEVGVEYEVGVEVEVGIAI